jgi:hypothetical protein
VLLVFAEESGHPNIFFDYYGRTAPVTIPLNPSMVDCAAYFMAVCDDIDL